MLSSEHEHDKNIYSNMYKNVLNNQSKHIQKIPDRMNEAEVVVLNVMTTD